MAVYTFTYFVLAFFAWSLRDRRVSWSLAIVAALFLALMAGSRYQVGCDYVGYLLRFQSVAADTSWVTVLAHEEPGFNGLVLALKKAGLTYDFLILIASCFYAFCLARFAILARSPLAFLALAFPVLLVQLGMSGLRQAVALGFLMLALMSFVRHQRLATAVWVLLGAQFHSSLFIFLPIVLLVGRRVSTQRILFALALLGPVVVFFLQSRFGLYSDRYIEQIYGENSASGAWFRYALVLLPFALLAIWYKRVETRYPHLIELMRLFMLVTFVIAPIGILSTVILHRLVFYVMPVSIITLLAVAETVAVIWRERLIRLIPYVIYGSYIVVWFSFSRRASSCYVPYQSWLF